MKNNPITSFEGEYRFLSNFYPSPLILLGVPWPTVEHFYQAVKFEDITQVHLIRECLSPEAAKRKAYSMKKLWASDWAVVKMFQMGLAVSQKFHQNPELKEKLIQTAHAELIEGNTWHDNYWGNCRCLNCFDTEGQNHLGKILMRVRKNLQS